MDISTVFGLAIGVGAVIVSFIMEGGSVPSLLHPSALLLVVGGTLGATIVCFPLKESLLSFKRLRIALVDSLKRDNLDGLALIEQFAEYTLVARRNGLLALQNDIPAIKDRFLRRGFELVIDGVDPDTIRSILETELEFMEQRHRTASNVFETAGGYAPTMGIIGTVMGLVQVLRRLDDPSHLGPAIATAFMATFYGIATANLFWLPIAAKLKSKSEREITLRRMMITALLSIQAGDSSRVMREKLEAFLGIRGLEDEGETKSAPEIWATEIESEAGDI